VTEPAASVSFDARPLVDPVDRFALQEYVQRHKDVAKGLGFGSAATVVPIVIGVAFFLAFGGVFFTVIVSIISSLASTATGSAVTPIFFAALSGILPVVIVAVAATIAILSFRRTTRALNERWYRLDRFAAANGMTFTPGQSTASLPGMIFGVGSARAASDEVRGEQPRFVEFANYQ